MPQSKEVANPSRFLNILSNKPKAAKHNKIKIIGFMHSFYYNNEKKSKKIIKMSLQKHHLCSFEFADRTASTCAINCSLSGI